MRDISYRDGIQCLCPGIGRDDDADTLEQLDAHVFETRGSHCHFMGMVLFA